MFSKKRLQNNILSFFIISAFLFNAIIPINAQGDFVTSGRIGGSSSVYVWRESSTAKKSNYASKRKSVAKRTPKQRRVTRKTIAKQSVVVAKKNRVRRTIKKVTPKELEVIDVERKTPQEASKILAGAGEYFVELDDYDKAVGYLEQAVELDDKNKDAKLALSEAYTILGDKTLESADEYAELAAKAVAEKRNEDVKKYLTQESYARQAAEKNFRRAIELDDKNASAYASLGGYLDSLGKAESDVEAKLNYEKALSLDAALTNVKAPLGIIYYQAGLIEKAETYINEAIAGGEDNAETQYFLGLIRYKQNNNEAARKALEKSISLDKDNAEAYYYLGAVYSRLGNEEKAIEHYLNATSLDAKFVNAWFDLGVTYYNLGQFQKSIDAFDKAIRLNMNQSDEEKRIYAESFGNMAEAYRQTEQYDLAISKYRNAVDLVKDPELYSSFAFVLARDEKWSEAIRTFEKVTQMKPDGISFANLGWAYYQESQYQANFRRFDKQKASLLKGKTALQTAINDNPNLAAAYLNLGLTLNDLGEYQEAIKILEKANSMQKKWVFAVNELGNAYRNNKDYDNAVKNFKKAIDMDKKYAIAYFGLGEAEISRNRVKEANKALDDLRKLDTKLADKLAEIIKKATF